MLLQEGLWQTPLFMCTEEGRVREGLHSWCPACVLVDMARLYKILQLVSSQRPVSKHASSVFLRGCLSRRPPSPTPLGGNFLQSEGRGQTVAVVHLGNWISSRILEQSSEVKWFYWELLVKIIRTMKTFLHFFCIYLLHWIQNATLIAFWSVLHHSLLFYASAPST